MNDPSPFAGYGYLTVEEPPIAGRIREKPEDFIVEEIPAYEPCGEGTHTYAFVEKRGMGTLEAIERLARAIDRHPDQFGYAGLKDAHAITRQWISIEHIDPEALAGAGVGGLRVLNTAQHGNKLRIGHLRGNRFRIRIAGTDEVERIARILVDLARTGTANWYGPQRFGIAGNGHHLGRMLVLGEYDAFVDRLLQPPEGGSAQNWQLAYERWRAGDPREAMDAMPRSLRDQRRVLGALVKGKHAQQAVRTLSRRVRQLLISAYQSFLFNRVLSRRLSDVTAIRVGDVAFLHRNGASFLVEDAEAERPRVEALEISPSGPIYGSRMMAAQGEPGRVEAEVLSSEGLSPEIFGRIGEGFAQKGARRPLRVPVEDVGAEAEGDGVRVTFSLPKGSFATTVVEEILKTRLLVDR